MTKTYLITRQGVRENVSLDEWRSLVVEECGLLWVDVRGVEAQEIEDLAAKFGFHDLTVESCLSDYRRPHLYEFDDHLYVNLTLVRSDPQAEAKVRPGELHLFAGERYLVTVSREEAAIAVDRTLNDLRAAPSACDRGPIYAVYLLTEDLVESYYPVIEGLDDEADSLETEMLERADQDSLAKLLALKRRGFELRRLLGPQRDILSELARRDFPFLEGENTVYFQDIYSRMIRLFDMMDTIREILSGSLDVYLSTVSNRLNEVMKVLTVAATILMTLSFVTGFYGMNFVHLPWLRSPNAFRNVLVGMGAATAAMLWWFRRKRWL